MGFFKGGSWLLPLLVREYVARFHFAYNSHGGDFEKKELQYLQQRLWRTSSRLFLKTCIAEGIKTRKKHFCGIIASTTACYLFIYFIFSLRRFPVLFIIFKWFFYFSRYSLNGEIKPMPVPYLPADPTTDDIVHAYDTSDYHQQRSRGRGGPGSSRYSARWALKLNVDFSEIRDRHSSDPIRLVRFERFFILLHPLLVNQYLKKHIYRYVLLQILEGPLRLLPAPLAIPLKVQSEVSQPAQERRKGAPGLEQNFTMKINENKI